jgi:hypothetical protein
MYGREEMQEGFAAAHTAAFVDVLGTPITELEQEISGSAGEGQSTDLLKSLSRREVESLIPANRGAGLDSHFRLVLYVLSCLAPGTAASNPEDACRSQSPVR